MNTVLEVKSLRDQATRFQRSLYEKGKRWAQRDLPQWRRTIRWAASRGDTYCNSGQLIPTLVGAFCSIFGPFRNQSFMNGYVEGLQEALGEGFNAKDSTIHGDYDDWSVAVRWD